ncbi:MAG: hypothetical protein Q9207_004579 [Kuettlingeria erythrocarpa]
MTSKAGPQIKRKSVPLISTSADSFQIGPLPASLSDPLTNGTSIPAPESSPPPPQEAAMRPATPSQQQAPLSDAAYNQHLTTAASPPMPGSFPGDEYSPYGEPPSQASSKLQRMGYQASASASPSPYATSSQPSTKSPRRPSSVFRLLPSFKRSYNDRTSSSADSFASGRPQTPSGESVMGSLADSSGDISLKKKKSGTFWGRRKSSLSHMTATEEAVTQNGHTTGFPTQQRTVSGTGNSGEAVYDGEEEFPPRLKKKKSMTFWRRTSSMGLDRMGSGYGQQQQQQQPPARNGSASSGVPGINGYQEHEDTVMNEPDPITLRPRSPPPRLPEVGHVLQEGGGLMGGEDWFGNIR